MNEWRTSYRAVRHMAEQPAAPQGAKTIIVWVMGAILCASLIGAALAYLGR